VPRLAIRREPLGARGHGQIWPWRIYCDECDVIRCRYEVGGADTFANALYEARHHARVYHEVAL